LCLKATDGTGVVVVVILYGPSSVSPIPRKKTKTKTKNNFMLNGRDGAQHEENALRHAKMQQPVVMQQNREEK